VPIATGTVVPNRSDSQPITGRRRRRPASPRYTQAKHPPG
jgi:hypothetical protein